MKKLILATATALAALTPAAAETVTIGGGTDLPLGIPFDCRSQYSASQNILTHADLDALYKVGTDGSIQKAQINSITVYVNHNDLMWAYQGYIMETTLYVSNASETAYVPDSNNKYEWLPYSNGVKVSVSWTGNETEWENAVGEFCGVTPMTFTFDTPLTYEGESLVLTWLCDFDGVDTGTGSELADAWNPGDGIRTLFASSDTSSCDDLSTGLVGSANTSSWLPAVTFDYTMVTEAAPGPVRGDAADFFVGPYEDFAADPTASAIDSSVGHEIPVGTDYTYCGAQMLYTPDVLNGLCKVEADGALTNAEISELTFLAKTQAWGYMSEGPLEFKIYVQTTDDTAFPQDASGKIKWFEYTKEHTAEYSVTLDYYDNLVEWENTANGMDDVVPMTLKLNEPIMYTGGSLLITVSGSSEFNEQLICGSLGFEPSEKIVHSVNCADSRQTFDDFYATGYPKNTFSWLPVLKLGYVPVTEAATKKPVVFENVEVAVEGLTVDAAVAGKLGNNSGLNNIAIHFSLNDPTACGEYEIKMGTTSLGTIHSTDATINFVGLPKNDIVLSVVPAGADAIGTTFTVAAADIAALFPAPDVAVNGYALYTAYTLASDRRATIQGAVQYKMSCDVPVARMSTSNVTGNAKLMTTGGDYPECFEVLVPEHATVNDFSDYALNNGLISFYSANLGSVDIIDGALADMDTYSLTVSFAAKYPVLAQTVPALVEGREAYALPITSAAGRSVVDNTVAYVGSGYPKDACTARLTPDDVHFTVDVTYPEALKVEVDKVAKTIKFTAPRGKSLWYVFVPNRPAQVSAFAIDDTEATDDLQWTKADTNPWTFDMTANADGTLRVKTIDDTTAEEADAQTFAITADGAVSGVADITLDASAPASYYDMRGVRVDGSLAPGLYIRRQGDTVAKVLVK